MAAKKSRLYTKPSTDHTQGVTQDLETGRERVIFFFPFFHLMKKISILAEQKIVNFQGQIFFFYRSGPEYFSLIFFMD